MAKDEYWFNTKTHEVEVGKKSLSLDRIGPFDTFEDAKNAEEIIRSRAAALRSEDESSDNWPS